MFNSERRRRSLGRSESVRVKSRTRPNSAPPNHMVRRWAPPVLGIATALITTLLIGGGAPPFAYRLGQWVDREIRLKIDLEISNDTKTRNEREEQANRSPLVFVNDPTSVDQLREKLQTLAGAIAKQPVFEQLDPLLREEWDLTAAEFKTLRSLLHDAEAPLRKFATGLDRVFEPLRATGVLDKTSLPTNRQSNASEVRILPEEGGEPLDRPMEDVLLSTLLLSDSPLGRVLDAQWPNKEEAEVVRKLIVGNLKPNLRYEPARTAKEAERRKQAVAPVVEKYAVGSQAVPLDQEITSDQLRLLRAEHAKLIAEMSLSGRLARFVGLLAVVTTLVATLGIYLKTFEPNLYGNWKQLGGLCALAVATIALGRLLGIEPYQATVLPIAVGSLLLTIAHNRSYALAVAIALSLIASLMGPDPMNRFIVYAGGTTVGILVLDTVRSRTKLIMVGFYAGLSYALLVFCVDLMAGQPWALIRSDVGWQFGSGLFAGFFISGSLPFVESTFGIVTDISLLELADTSHPLLQELVRRAPGTYTHSSTVSFISEAAAKSIGCNSLKVRVGALFHDIGKMLKPGYFIENKSADDLNRHDQLEPAMSTLIIIGHVKDGADLARQHHLPQPIIDMIEQHHGTTLVDYFYQEATRGAKKGEEADEAVEESAFRYPGPRPQTKEAAVLMLADCVESASRTLSEPTPARIEKLVHRMALNRLLDGQFNESGVTLQEVKAIEDSLTKSLTSVYHGRIKYPAAG